MKLREFLQKESTISLPALLGMASIAGISNAAILGVINAASALASADTQSFQHLALFAIILALYIVAQRYIMLTSSGEIERILHRIRVRVADKVRRGDLMTLEQIGRSEIYASVSKETLTVSHAAAILVVGAQSAILIAFTVLYIAWLSLTAFVLSVGFTGIAISIHLRQRKRLSEDVHQSMTRENQFFDSLTAMLDGFKELKMNRERSADLFAHISEISESTTVLKIKTQSQLATNFIFSQAIFYLLVATIVFIVPQFSPTYSDVVIKATTAVLFLIGPITNMVASIPVLEIANAACENIAVLEKKLDRSLEPAVGAAPPLTSFCSIRLQRISFSYTDPSGAASFSVGPLNLTIPAGELLFISGGNGSGKSTFLKLLTGLYRPTAGVIRVDGVSLTDVNLDAYRQLFSVIFSDYHLFKRLYGLRDIEAARIHGLLKEMEIEKKTQFVDDEFQTLDLSTGQKKRLALLVALLEDKPIYVFDEWAADQDPIFRGKFYQELLPRLKARGKTVLAVTHDDRYYDVADRIARMEDGRIVDLARGSKRGG